MFSQLLTSPLAVVVEVVSPGPTEAQQGECFTNFGSMEDDPLTREHSGRLLGGYDMNIKKIPMLE